MIKVKNAPTVISEETKHQNRLHQQYRKNIFIYLLLGKILISIVAISTMLKFETANEQQVQANIQCHLPEKKTENCSSLSESTTKFVLKI